MAAACRWPSEGAAVAETEGAEAVAEAEAGLARNEFVGRRVQKVCPGKLKMSADGAVNRPPSYGGFVSERESFEGCVYVIYDDGDSEHMSLIELKVWLADPPEFQFPCKRSRGG